MNCDLDELAKLIQALNALPSGEERDRAESTAVIVRDRICDALRRDQAAIDRIEDAIVARADAQRWSGLDVMDFFDQETAKDRYWVEMKSRADRSRQCLDELQSARMNLISRKM
jgi:hypothetical protein